VPTVASYDIMCRRILVYKNHVTAIDLNPAAMLSYIGYVYVQNGSNTTQKTRAYLINKCWQNLGIEECKKYINKIPS